MTEKYKSRLRLKFNEEIRGEIKKELGIESSMAIPKIEKVTINMGLGESLTNKKVLEDSVKALTSIAGQKPVVTKARKAISNFNIKRGMPVGAFVTLRGESMYDFLDKLLNIALPRVKDFRGVSAKGFDGRGNYNLGISDFIIFPEVNFSDIEKSKGMTVTIVTSAEDDKQAKALLEKIGVPFKKV